MQNQKKEKKKAEWHFFYPCHDSWSGIYTPLNFRKKNFIRSNRNEKIM